MSVVDAVAGFVKAHPAIKDDPIAAMAQALAVEIDDPGNSATSKSMCAARLMDALDALRLLAPEQVEGTPLDEIRARRDRRLGGADTEVGDGAGGGAAPGRVGGARVGRGGRGGS